MKRLLRYNQEINKFNVDDVLNVFSSSFPLSGKEIEALRELLNFYYEAFSRGYGITKNYDNVKEDLKVVKEVCEEDWKAWMKKDYNNLSALNHRFLNLIRESHRPRQLRDSIAHTALRIGEFFYISDREMEKISLDMAKFIDSGDCKLFDYDGAPYRDVELEESLEKDIHNKGDLICQYIQKQVEEKKLPPVDISPEEVLRALEQIREWMLLDLRKCPEWARPFIQICKEIKAQVRRHDRDFEDLKRNGIPQDLIMKKRSGFCLNKEIWFRDFLEKTKMVSWKNPEGSWIVGSTHLPIPEALYKDTMRVEFWNMDVIYYSLGKGPWLKTRYVGQPCAFFQNIAEVLATIIKTTIKRHASKYKKAMEEGEETELLDISGINIYENYNSLIAMMNVMKDSIAIDFSSYSDYLSRNIFTWIMDYLWGVPRWYRDIIAGMMALPIKVNGQEYKHLHGSVMGIKLNFLLITFANMVMWMVGNVISGCEDRAKFMGDDRISIHPYRKYEEREYAVSLGVTAFFNCVVNGSKTEWLQRDGFTSFCKRTFNKYGEQITGLGGEFLLKQKPFLNDVSVWENVCYHNDIPLTEDQVEKWVKHWSEYYLVSYAKFHQQGDPELGDMAAILQKIPFCYGGWSLEDSTEYMDIIMLKSVMNTINVIIEESVEDQSSPSLNRIREYIRINGGEENRYYLNLMDSSSYSAEYERIQEYVLSIAKVMNNNCNTLEDMRAARSASQRIMEIILERDSRLASSTSTKNRIDYTFDQDRISKIRAKGIAAAFEEQECKLKSGVLDQAVLQSRLDSQGSSGVKDYLEYLRKKAEAHVSTDFYIDMVNNNFYAMIVWRDNPDGSGRRMFYKRISANDSYYNRIKLENGKYTGSFVTYADLFPVEKEIYDYLQDTKIQKIVQELDRIVNNQIDGMKNYLLNWLADRYSDIIDMAQYGNPNI